MVRFGPDPTRPGAGRRPPPDYLSRSMQTRLLLLFASLACVLFLMREARKPERWAWMWAGVVSGGASADSEVLDTRLQTSSAGGDGMSGTFRNAGEGAEEVVSLLAEPDGDDPLERARLDGWSHVLAGLERADRVRLDRVLKAARDSATLSAEARLEWEPTLEKLARGWGAFLEQATASLTPAGVSADERERWTSVLRTLRAEWSEQVEVALRAPREGRAWTETDRRVLDQAQTRLDVLALRAVRDDTVWRAAEQDAWFRLLERLQTSDPAELRAESIGDVGYAALFRQASFYRGKLVTVRGTACLAYHVAAPPNIHGIQGYYVFWLRPRGGPNLPLVVYALGTPPGFPPIRDKDRDGQTTRLDEKLEFTGFFFKRWAYRAKDGLNTAPLMAANVPRWFPASAADQPRRTPGMTTLGVSILAVAVLSIVLTVLVHRATRTIPWSRRQVSVDEKLPDKLAWPRSAGEPLAQDETLPPTEGPA